MSSQRRVKFTKKSVRDDLEEDYSSFGEAASRSRDRKNTTDTRSFASLSRSLANGHNEDGYIDSDQSSGSDQEEEQNEDQEEEQIEYKSGKRKHKHAPSEQSSKKPVSWVREIPGFKKFKTAHRDVRFDPAFGKADLEEARKNYAFLDEYRESEISSMKEQLKQTQDTGARHRIKRELEVMQSRLKTLKDRDFESKILAEHRPTNGYHLKRSEQRKIVLAEKFKTMKKKDINRAIERKRKKEAGKEKKALPTRRNN